MRTTGRTGPTLAVLGLLGIGPLAGPVHSRAEGPDGMLTLTLPRQPAADEGLVLRLSVGVLPEHARVVVQTIDGTIAGTIAPYGVRPGRKAGVYTIPVPAKAVTGDKVTLRLDVLEKGAKAARPPARAEIEEAKLAFIPVGPRRDRPETPKKPSDPGPGPRGPGQPPPSPSDRNDQR